MAHFVKRIQFGAINVYRTFNDKPDEELVASFPFNTGGELGYALFVKGAAVYPQTPLFDRDTGQWIVGNIDQLDKEPAR